MSEYDFDRVYHELFPTVFRVAFRIAGERGLAEDLTHEAFLRLITRETPLPDVDQTKYWLLRVVRNLSLNHEKSRERERRAVGRLENDGDNYALPADAALMAEATRDAVQEALNALPQNMRTALVLREYAGMSYREISSVLGISESNVKVRLHRARQRLAKQLADGVPHVP
jgi:RNA polymerase sigma-70 factor (ECF subfamily)